MANTFDPRPIGERNTAKRSADLPEAFSTIGPLPAYPNLKRILRSWTATMILTYIETLYPAIQDAAGRYIEPPTTISLDQMSQDLQVGRRTLFTALCVLCARYRNEGERARSARGAREFFNIAHTTNGTIKHYSYVGPSSHRPGTTFTVRRNHRLIEQTLQRAGIARQQLIQPNPTLVTPCATLKPLQTHAQSALQPLAALNNLPDRSNNLLPENEPTSAPSSTALDSALDLSKQVESIDISGQFGGDVSKRERLIDALLSGSVLSGDRRSVRYPRLRKAVEAGIESAEVLKVRFNPRSAAKRGVIPCIRKAKE